MGPATVSEKGILQEEQEYCSCQLPSCWPQYLFWVLAFEHGGYQKQNATQWWLSHSL